MTPHSLNWFVENGCELQRPELSLLAAIFYSQDGRPCDGCNCKNTCPAWLEVRKEEGR